MEIITVKSHVDLLESQIDEIFARTEAIFKGHFVYAAGGHGNVYVDKAQITFWPTETSRLCEDIAWRWRFENVEAVVGPAIGGIKLADRVAEWLTKFTGKQIPALYTEKDENGKLVLKRGQDKIKDKVTLVVEDILNTGKSANETIAACNEAGAIVVGCHALVNRSPGKVTAKTLGVPRLLVLKEMVVDNYPEKDCLSA